MKKIKNKIEEETEELRKVNPSFNAGYERAFAEVKKVINGMDFHCPACKEELKQKLGIK